MSITHNIPLDLEPGCRPGERMIAGRPYVFSLELLNAYLSDCLLAEAHAADLPFLEWNELTRLLYAYINRRQRFPDEPDTENFGKLLCAERASRPEYASFRKECM